jgi:signal transduction histidine kinase
MRTPLTIIKGHLYLLARTLRRGDAPDGEAVLARLAVIERAVGELAARITELDASLQAPPLDAGDDASEGR